MSWIEKAKTDYSITTGDGAVYTVNWLNAVKEKEFNISLFEYPGIKGTDARRKLAKGRRYALEIYFQGDDHLDTAAAFDTSSDDVRPWVIAHPFYGTLTVQPVSLQFDNTGYNVTKITGTVIETITEGQATVGVAIEDKITQDKANADLLLAETYATQVQPTARDIEDMKANNTAIYNEGLKSATDTLDTENYINAFNTAETAVNNATSDPLEAMRKTQALINAPVQFAANVKQRLNTLTTQFTTLRNTVATILTRNGKKGYEEQGGTIIGAMALATVTNFTRTGDYNNRAAVVAVIETLLTAYSNYITDLDSLQTLTGGDPDSYIPDFDGLFALGVLMSYTVGNLFKIAENSKQERVVYTRERSNPILLAYKYYGMANENNINLLMDSNNMGLSELFIVQKGRRIIYYV